jgi:predicted dehydrogenase
MENYGTSYKGDGGRDASKEPGVNAYITFRNGVRGILMGWKRIPQDMVVHVVGSLARIELDVEGWRMITTPASDNRAPTPDLGRPYTTVVSPRSSVDGMSAAIRELLRAMEDGGPVTSPGETARRTVAITDAILRSQAGGNVRVDVVPPPWGVG